MKYTGGTWNGATEAIKNKWGRVFVWNNSSVGNNKLIEKGGHVYEIGEEKLVDTILKKKEESVDREYMQMTLTDMLQ